MRIWGLGLLILVLIFFGRQALAADFDRSQWDKRIALRGGVIRYNMSGDFNSNKDDRPNYNIDLGDLGLDDDWENAGACNLTTSDIMRMRPNGLILSLSLIMSLSR